MKKSVLACLLILLGPTLFGLQTSEKGNEVRSAMKDITTIATALADYITDFGKFPVQAGPFDQGGVFVKALSPFYVISLPTKDPWGHDYLVYCGKPFDGIYGLKETMTDDMLVVSYGQDGVQDNWRYDPSHPEAGLYDPAEIKNDLVMFNGAWVRAPRPRLEQR